MNNPTLLANWLDEMNSASLYEALAALEKKPKLAEVYRRLSATERGHAELWADRLRDAGGSAPPFRPNWRTRALIWLAGRFGVEAILPSLSSTEDVATQNYAAGSEGQQLAATEQSHARLLRQIGHSARGGLEGAALAQIEGRHRTAGGNALRAAVLGANDGLVSNLSLSRSQNSLMRSTT